MLRASMFVVALMLGSAIGGSVATAFLLRPHGAIAQSDAITASVVTMREFRLVDEAGKVRIRAGIADDGQVFFNLRDASQSPKLVLWTTTDGEPGLELRDENGKVRASLSGVTGSSGHSGPVQLSFSNAAGKSLLSVGEFSDAALPYVRLRDGDGNIRLSMRTLEDGTPTVTLSDTQRPRTAWSMFPDGTAALNIWDADGRLIWVAPQDAGLPIPTEPADGSP